MTVTVIHTNGVTTVVRDIDSTRVDDGVLYLKRARYNGGIHETVKALPLANIQSWSSE